MFKILFALFLIIPLLEIAILIEIGKVVGAGYTILLVIGTAALGAALLRQQGVSTLVRVQQQLDQGHLPATELLEGLILLIAGALLLTPGFFTDIIGFAMLVPALRLRFVQHILKNFLTANFRVTETENGTIIEGEHWESGNDQINKK